MEEETRRRREGTNGGKSRYRFQNQDPAGTLMGAAGL